MTRNFCPDHVPTDDVVEYYRRRAEGGVGLIISEGTVIDHPAANGYPGVPHFYGDEALAGWKRVVDAVHAAGGRMFPQLWHVGSVRQMKGHGCDGSDNPSHRTECERQQVPGFGPSPVAHPYVENGEVPHEMTESDIADVIASFARAAANSRRCGFDGVELHAAHGYLIDQFLWDRTNRRTDRYGEDRGRFAVEVVQAVREAVGPDYTIDLRISQWKLGDYSAKMVATSEELEQFLAPLVDAGVDIFHCSTRRFWEPEFDGSTLNFAGWVQKLTGKPAISVGSVGLADDFIHSLVEEVSSTSGRLGELEQRLTDGEFALIALGRSLLADPNWLQKFAEGRSNEIIPFKREALETLY